MQKRLFLFKRFLYYKPRLEIKIRMVLADSFILSQLRAFLFIWFPHNYYSKIKTIFNETMKVTLGLRKSVPIATRYTILGWLSIKDQIFVQYMKILSKIKSLRSDHELTKETNLDEILKNIKDKDHPTLYHKQLVQKYQKYPIEEKYLKVSHHQTKNYLSGLIAHTHITKLIPEQIQREQQKDPQTGTTTKKFNSYAQDPSYWLAIEKLKRYPATISQPILQLMTEWSYLNYSGYRYDILATPNCPVCKTPETTEHYLLHCLVFDKPRHLLLAKLKSYNLTPTLKNIFGITQITSQQRHSLFMSLYDYISHTKRKKLGYNQNLISWKKLEIN